jgi:probable HAF family extracellular repeat protein
MKLFGGASYSALFVVMSCAAEVFAGDACAPPPLPRYSVTAVAPAPGFDYFEPKRINNRGEMVGRLDASTGIYQDESHAGFHMAGSTLDLHLMVPGRDTDRTSLPIDLNDNGQLLFYSDQESWLYQDGHLQGFSELTGRTNLTPLAINNSGQIVGTIELTDNSSRAFSYVDGNVHLLRGAGRKLPDSGATAVNNYGRIVGGVLDGSSKTEDFRAALFTRRHAIVLRVPFSYAVDVNDRGHVLIATHPAFSNHQGFLWRKQGQIIELPFSPSRMNNDDQVVGSLSSSWPPRAFLYSGNVTHNLNDLIDPSSGWELLYASDINNQGRVVGLGKVNGQWSGFLLTPVD